MDLRVKVIPKSSKNEVSGRMADGTLKVKIAATPEKGKANAALCRLLAEYFGVSMREVEILSGETSQLKRIRIAGK